MLGFLKHGKIILRILRILDPSTLRAIALLLGSLRVVLKTRIPALRHKIGYSVLEPHAGDRRHIVISIVGLELLVDPVLVLDLGLIRHRSYRAARLLAHHL